MVLGGLKSDRSNQALLSLEFKYRRWGSNPHGRSRPEDFKSSASAASVATILADRLPSDESDVVSKSLVLACERLAEFRGDENAALLGWLATIVKHEALQTLRRTKRLGPLPVGPDGAEALARDSAGPLVHASRREQAARLLAAVEKLPEVYRQIIELHGLEELAYVSVAERMGRTYADVRRRGQAAESSAGGATRIDDLECASVPVRFFVDTQRRQSSSSLAR